MNVAAEKASQFPDHGPLQQIIAIGEVTILASFYPTLI